MGVAFRLVTVPHAGTVFTRGVLSGLGFDEPADYTSHHTDDLAWSGGRVVVAVRDPMLCEISRRNRGDSGLPVQEWLKLVPFWGRDDVWWFLVDCAEPRRRLELAGLAAFLGVSPHGLAGVDWEPINTSPDRTGAKAAYLEGEVLDCVRPAFEWLQQAEGVKDVFSGLGYRLLWM